jgi:hypothetical protein
VPTLACLISGFYFFLPKLGNHLEVTHCFCYLFLRLAEKCVCLFELHPEEWPNLLHCGWAVSIFTKSQEEKEFTS